MRAPKFSWRNFCVQRCDPATNSRVLARSTGTSGIQAEQASNPSTDQYGSSWWNGVRNCVPAERTNTASKKKLTASTSMSRPAISATSERKAKSRYSGVCSHDWLS